MKKSLPILITFLSACAKVPINNNESVTITYELQTSVGGFIQIQYGTFYSLSNGSSGIQFQNWTVSGTGTFTHTESIRKGFIAEIHAIHPTSANWSLRVISSTGTTLKTSVPSYITDSSFYYCKAAASAQ